MNRSNFPKVLTLADRARHLGNLFLTNEEEADPDQILSLQHPPFHHILQVGEPCFSCGNDVDGVGAEGAVDKPPGMQISQGVRNLEQQVHDHLHVQHGELGALESREKTARNNRAWAPDAAEFFEVSKAFSIVPHSYLESPFYTWGT